MKIIVDADGCPVVPYAIEAARAYGLECLLVCDTSHVFERDGAVTLTVSKGADSADYAIVNRLDKGDIVVTQDYGLAAMALARNGYPITQNGLIITDANIGALLESRHISKKIRSSGGRLKGPHRRTAEQDASFQSQLRVLLEQRS